MIDFAALRLAVAAHGSVVRLVLADVQGSAPRELGVSMLIWQDDRTGTIGGGRIEFDAVITARNLLRSTGDTVLCETHLRVETEGLGPDEVDTGRMTLVYEVYDDERLSQAEAQSRETGIYLRRVLDEAPCPDAFQALCDRAYDGGLPVDVALREGWMIEPVWQSRLAVIIYGAGHVGRALSTALAPFSQFDVYLSDVREDQFDALPDAVTQSWKLLPTDVMAQAPDTAAHFIMTPEKEYDLELCHRLLSRSFGYAGLIGSASKWARFRTRLQDQGHSTGQIDRIQCPVGDPRLGKHPQAIAIGIVAQLLVYQAGMLA